ncbi:MAG: hypothetical protein GXY46_00895 [Actinobacteria bacterium]|nr:hypothetical protein [Actinomycetota bacterium]
MHQEPGGLFTAVDAVFADMIGAMPNVSEPIAVRVYAAVMAELRQDHRALALLTAAGYSGACAQIMRSIFETIVDFFLMTSGSREQQRRRVAAFFVHAAVEQTRHQMLHDELTKTRKSGRLIDGSFPAMRQEAVQESRQELNRFLESDELHDSQSFASLVSAELKDYEESGEPRHWSRLDLVSRIEQLDGITSTRKSNFFEAYRLYYSLASGFVHGGSALSFTLDTPSGPGTFGLITGRFTEGHLQPVVLSVLFASDFFGRFMQVTGMKSESFGQFTQELEAFLEPILTSDTGSESATGGSVPNS